MTLTDRRVVAHLHQPTVKPTARPVPYACTWAVAAMDSCFALIGAHQHGVVVGHLYGQSPVQLYVPQPVAIAAIGQLLSLIGHFEVALKTDSVSCVILPQGIVFTQFPAQP